MRQITNEFTVDPSKSIQVEAMPAPNLTAAQQQQLEHWMATKTVTMAHKYCAAKVNFLKEGSADNFQNCLDRYAMGLSLFKQEQATFNGELQRMAANGQDRFAHFNQH